jgi:hypothetical protein
MQMKNGRDMRPFLTACEQAAGAARHSLLVLKSILMRESIGI